MKKTIRHTYPKELSIGLLILIFVLSMFLSTQVFNVRWRELMEGTPVYGGMVLISVTVLVMVLVLWEEFLFPIKVGPEKNGEMIFRNHRTKLLTQVLIYCAIPAIYIFVYYRFDVNLTRFIMWAVVCMVTPVVGRLISGINNYNDFLKLTDHAIEFKNNRKSAVLPVNEIKRITLVRDEDNVLHKLQVSTTRGDQLIDLDEMELEAFIESIDKFITVHYKTLIA
jgi:hypothetical protein